MFLSLKGVFQSRTTSHINQTVKDMTDPFISQKYTRYTILLLSYHQTQIWTRKRTIGTYINKKRHFWVVTASVFFQRFDSLMKSFFKFTRKACHGLLPFSPLLHCGWCGLCVVKGLECLCIQIVKCDTESYSVTVKVLGSHCAQGIFLR